MFIHGGVAILAQESEIAASLEYPASIIGALIGSRGAKINEDRGVHGRLPKHVEVSIQSRGVPPNHPSQDHFISLQPMVLGILLLRTVPVSEW